MNRYHRSTLVPLACAVVTTGAVVITGTVVALGTIPNLFLPSAFALRDEHVKGSGTVRQETRSVSGFHAVEAGGVAELSFQQNDSESLKIEAEDNILPLIESRVENGVLHLGLRSGASVSTKRPIRYTISVRDLDTLELSGIVQANVPKVRTSGRFTLNLTGAARVNIPSLNADSLTAAMTGAARAKLGGTAASQELRLTGASMFDASGFTTDTTHAVMAGASHARVHATQKLDVVASGASSVSYTGSPQVTRTISGASSVVPTTRR